MTKGTRYVEIPADRLVSELEYIGGRVAERGGSFSWSVSGRERVFDLVTPARVGNVPAVVRVFTTLDGGATARDCGEDAIRVCLGALQGDRFRPLEKGQKVLRTAPANGDRVASFLERLRGIIREAYGRAKEVRACPKCGRPMARREGNYGPFLGCTGYPECRGIVNLPREGAQGAR